MPGARFFLDGDRMIVALGNAGEERMYVVDASSQQTTSRLAITTSTQPILPARRCNSSRCPATNPARRNRPSSPKRSRSPSAPLPSTCTTSRCSPSRSASAALDDVYGVLGLDVLDQLRAYTFDYRTMRFSVKPE